MCSIWDLPIECIERYQLRHQLLWAGDVKTAAEFDFAASPNKHYTPFKRVTLQTKLVWGYVVVVISLLNISNSVILMWESKPRAPLIAAV